MTKQGVKICKNLSITAQDNISSYELQNSFNNEM